MLSRTAQGHRAGRFLIWNLRNFDENVLLNFTIYVKTKTKETKQFEVPGGALHCAPYADSGRHVVLEYL
jgi:hypothetical protein